MCLWRGADRRATLSITSREEVQIIEVRAREGGKVGREEGREERQREGEREDGALESMLTSAVQGKTGEREGREDGGRRRGSGQYLARKLFPLHLKVIHNIEGGRERGRGRVNKGEGIEVRAKEGGREGGRLGRDETRDGGAEGRTKVG